MKFDLATIPYYAVTMNSLVERLKKQKKYAWGKYFEAQNQNHNNLVDNYNMINQIVEHIPLPIYMEYKEMFKELKKKIDCPICLETIDPGKLALTHCGHKYCETCFNKIKSKPDAKCAMCRKPLK